ncbi:MAG: PAS domain-containing protein, partial [Chloroflexi bacterium]|nr:PAS domain-containing protein [Chloroflexota bacterium]
MSKRGVSLEALDAEAQFIWTASGDGIVGKSACLWCAYTGQQEEETQAWGWTEALHPDDRERVRQLWLQAAEQKRFYETCYRVRHYAGEYRAFIMRCMPILNDDSTLREWVSQFAFTTTEQRETQEAAELAGQLKAVFEAMTDGVTFRDVNGNLLLINAAARRLLELGSEIDVTGEPYQNLSSLYRVYDEHKQLLSIEQWPVSRFLHGEVLSGEQAVDAIVRMPSGREVEYGFSGAPVYDRGGHMVGSVCVFHDISESRQRERSVQQAFNALLTIMEEVARLPIQADEPTEAMPVPLLHTIGNTLTGIIRQVLQCYYVACCSIEPQTGKYHLVGVSGLMAEEESIYRQEVEQSTIFDYLEAEDVAHLRANEVLLRDLVTRPYVQQHTDFGIRYRMMAPMLLDGQLVGLLTIAQVGADLTYTPEEIALVKAIAKLILQIIERVRLTKEWTAARANELALGEANRRFDAFLSIASHELRTPLTTIKGNVQLALRRMETLKSQYTQQLASLDSYEQIMRALERVHLPLMHAAHRTRVQERMISDLLDASRIRAN